MYMALDAVAEALVLGLEPLDRLLVLAPLVSVAGLERLAHPVQHLVVEAQPAEQFGELRSSTSSRTYCGGRRPGLPWHLSAYPVQW